MINKVMMILWFVFTIIAFVHNDELYIILGTVMTGIFSIKIDIQKLNVKEGKEE